MKKAILFLVLPFIVTSCYEDYVLDYDYSGIYFPNPVNVRTVVVGEGMKIRVGAQLAGVLHNDEYREVNFVIQDDLITPGVLEEMQNHIWSWVSEPSSNVTELKPLPQDFYTLSNPGLISIEEGWHSGNVTLAVDSVKFLSDSATINPVYAVSFQITSADADTIPESLSTTIIGLRYENMLFGNYLHGGVTTITNEAGEVVETITYPTAVNQSEAEIMKLTTVAPHTVVTNGYSRTRTSGPEIELTLNGTDIAISSSEASSINFQANGASSFNGSKLLQERKLFLNYTYEEDGLIHTCQDTLTFRNRIRDGVNEWQDENPDNY